MQIYCRQCGKEILAANMNLDNMIAKCHNCNAVFKFADMYEGVEAKSKAMYEEVPIPQGTKIHYGDNHLVIERRWPSFLAYFVTGFAIIWNGATWCLAVPTTGMSALPFIIVGLFLGYGALAGMLNITKIQVDATSLDIQYVPIPVPLKRHVGVDDIQQLFTRQRINHSKHGASTTYDLLIIRANGVEDILLENLERPEFALFVEQEVENCLGIENYPVRGEYQ